MFIFSFNNCISFLFSILSTYSTFSLEYAVKLIWIFAFKLIFLPFIILHSSSVKSVVHSNCMLLFKSFISIFLEKSMFAFIALMLEFSSSAIYTTYALTVPSILTLPSCTSFLCKQILPLLEIILKTSGLMSGTISSLSIVIFSFFCSII